MQQEQLMSSREKEIEGYRKIKKKERKRENIDGAKLSKTLNLHFIH